MADEAFPLTYAQVKYQLEIQYDKFSSGPSCTIASTTFLGHWVTINSIK